MLKFMIVIYRKPELTPRNFAATWNRFTPRW